MQYNIFQFIRGSIGGILVVLLLGTLIHVNAVAPGAVKNPTFAPSQEDVDAAFQLDCIDVRSDGTATCPAGYFVTGGGISCGNDGDSADIVPNLITQSIDSSCDGAGDTSIAVCCRIQ